MTVSVLYKYRSMNEYTKQIISDGKIYFAKLTELNDLFEYWFSFKEGGVSTLPNLSEKQIEILQVEKISDGLYNCSAEAKTIQFMSYMKRHMPGVFCLSESCDNPYMYSHYADSYKGICIGFNSRVFEKQPFSLRKMDYVDKPYQISGDNATSEDWMKITERKFNYFSKEKEWRVINNKGSGVYASEDIKASIAEIIFGFAVSKDTVECIQNSVLNTQTKLYVAKPVIGEYRLEISEFRDYKTDIQDFQELYGYGS